jgi:RNA polymerase sigma factor (sigma-70 family)
MQWDLRFKGLDEEARIARILARWRSKLERQVQRFASDRVSLRGLVERHSNKRRFRVMLLLSVPGRMIVAKEEGASLEPVVKEAFTEVLRQLAKHQAMLRREPLWKRRERREAATLAATIKTVPLEERDRDALLDVLGSRLDIVSRFAAHEIAARLAAGDLFPGQVSVEDVVDAVVLEAAQRFAERPKDLPLDRWLMKLVLDQVEREVRRTRDEGGALRLEEASAMPGSEDGLFDFYQPDEVVRLEDVVPVSALPTPEQVVERQDLQRTINQMLAHLPKQWRLALVLHEVEGCSIAETAHVLGITEANAKEALDSARAFLRQQLAERYPSQMATRSETRQETKTN